jgi:hypothetical protein
VAVFELHAGPATPSGDARSQPLAHMAPGARARHAIPHSAITAPTPPLATRGSTGHAPAGRVAPEAGPARLELEAAGGEATAGGVPHTSPRGGPAASVRPALTTPPAVSPHVRQARQGARAVKTLLGETVSRVRAAAQPSIGAASADLDAPVTSVAGTAEGAREDAGATLGHVAREGQRQLAAISPLG